jgi:hypothetical protein
MSTPSKFPASAYFGAALLVLFFFLTCFQAQGQVSSEPKDTVLVLKKEKATYVPYPIYIDASIELGFGMVGANANAGVYLNHKHAIGLSIFAVGTPSLGDSYNISCLGLQYSINTILDASTDMMVYYKLEAGKVINYSWGTDSPTIVIGSAQNDLKQSKPYYGRITAGLRVWCFNFYAALGSTGKLKTNYEGYKGQIMTNSFNFTHFTFGGGLSLPMHKSKKTSASK